VTIFASNTTTCMNAPTVERGVLSTGCLKARSRRADEVSDGPGHRRTSDVTFRASWIGDYVKPSAPDVIGQCCEDMKELLESIDTNHPKLSELAALKLFAPGFVEH
jgi:hypothetical protein